MCPEQASETAVSNMAAIMGRESAYTEGWRHGMKWSHLLWIIC